MKDSIARKIRALQAKTITNGCTEAEAVHAIEKIAQLVDQYNITLTEVEVREEGCERVDFHTNTKQMKFDHRGYAFAAIGKLTQCKVWRRIGEETASSFTNTPGIYCYRHKPMTELFSALGTHILRVRISKGTKYVAGKLYGDSTINAESILVLEQVQ